MPSIYTAVTNSSLGEAEEQPSVCTGIMKTATIMTAHTELPVY